MSDYETIIDLQYRVQQKMRGATIAKQERDEAEKRESELQTSMAQIQKEVARWKESNQKVRAEVTQQHSSGASLYV